MKVQLVKEVTESLRITDKPIWEGEIAVPESNPPIECVQFQGEVYKFAYKFDGTYVYRHVVSFMVAEK